MPIKCKQRPTYVPDYGMYEQLFYLLTFDEWRSGRRDGNLILLCLRISDLKRDRSPVPGLASLETRRWNSSEIG